MVGNVQRRDGRYIGQRVLNIEMLGRRKIGRSQRRVIDVLREDMQRVGVTEKDKEHKQHSLMAINC